MATECGVPAADYEVRQMEDAPPQRPANAAKSTRLLAPMPGVVTICEKQVGDVVCEGEVVLILEAMKMENLVTAPISGKLLSSCREGERVAKGAVLAQIG